MRLVYLEINEKTHLKGVPIKAFLFKCKAKELKKKVKEK